MAGLVQLSPYHYYPHHVRKPSVEDVGHPGSVNSRILELRKEKSRDAARSRRGKENYEFYELAKMLPLPAAITSQLDKASIIRLTISYLKLRDFSGHGDPPWARDKPPFSKSINAGPTSRTANIAHEIFEHHQGTHILQSLDGFAFALGADGRFLYISETVSIYLGLSQVEMTGSSVFDYVHHQDHSEMAEQLGLGLSQGGQAGIGSPQGSEEGTSASPVSSVMTISSNSSYKGFDRTFCVRMKSTLTKRGCHFKSSGYRVVLLLCRLRPQYQFSHSRKSSPPLLGMVSLAIALPPPSVHEIRLESDMFVTRLNFDFTIAHCEPKVSDLLDYTADEITGMNMYTLCHGEDAHRLRKNHIDLINKGQVLTHYYRFMNKNGGYTWVQTCATVVCNTKNADEQNIICVNYVVSGREYKNLIMDCCQLEDHVVSRGVKREDTSGNDPENGSPGSDTGEGRSSGGHHQEQARHLAGPEIEEEGGEGQGSEQRNRGLMDHPGQIHDHNLTQPTPTQMNTVHSRPVKKTAGGERRGVKRKAGEEESSCCSSDEEERTAAPRKRYPVLSPASSSCQSSALAGSPKGGPEDSDGGGGTSVKDLEVAMSKHLPGGVGAGGGVKGTPTDFSTDALLKAQQQRSTIQWIGTHHHHHPHLGHLGAGAPGTGPGGLPASTLLRQLYANRESVIRANVQGRAASGYYPEMSGQGPLPTPPGSDGYSDQFVLHSQKNDFLYSAATSYVDYHSAMTPPSSVSPRDKQQQVHSGFESPVYSEVRGYLPSGAEGGTGPPGLPLKPQPYPLDYATSSLDPGGGFYPSPGPTGFHLYTKTPTSPAGALYDPLKASSNWYTAPS